MAAHADKRSPHTDALDTLGTLIGPHEGRDAIHLAVENVVAGETLRPGDDIGFLPDGTVGYVDNPVGIVDPFLTELRIKKGDRFWLIVYPRKITSLRHVWSHPDIPSPEVIRLEVDTSAVQREVANLRAALAARDTELEEIKIATNRDKATSEAWMRLWAKEHMSYDYYGDRDSRSDDEAYESAINAGHHNSVGPHEDARDYIDDVWWDHWETITGDRGDRGSYFSCGC